MWFPLPPTSAPGALRPGGLMRRNSSSKLAAAVGAGAAGGGGIAPPGSAAPTAANPGPGFPARYSAPYAETWNSPSALANARNATGQKYFTLAFVIAGNGCNATFNGDTSITDSSWTAAIN